MTSKPAQKTDAADESDAALQRLERAFAAERQNAAALRQTVEELRFKIDVLGKGYEKQLGDARARAEKAEREAAELRERWDALGADANEALERLTAAQAELAAVNAERDRWRDAATGKGAAPGRAAIAPVSADTGLTINNLMAEIATLREASTAPERPASWGAALAAETQDEAASEPMLAPELVFTKDADDDDNAQTARRGDEAS